jgi:hypothetical protein
MLFIGHHRNDDHLTSARVARAVAFFGVLPPTLSAEAEQRQQMLPRATVPRPCEPRHLERPLVAFAPTMRPKPRELARVLSS